MKPGYKQTELGEIPNDWDVTTLGRHVSITSGESPSLIPFTPSGKPYFKVEQLGAREKYLDNASTPYHFTRGKTVPAYSVVFAKRGAAISLNRVRIIKEAAFMDTNLMALTPFDSLHHEYLYYALGHIGLWQFADTTSVPQINNKHVDPLPFPLPNINEQRAIAEALSDVDGLLGGLDRLVAKKRDLKQAAMQQLLTGQTRLPEFDSASSRLKLTEVGEVPDDWCADYIENIAQIATGSRNTQDKVEDGQYPFFVRSQKVERINSYSFDGEAVLTAGDGVGTGKVFHYINGKVEVHQRVYQISQFSERVNGYFFYLYFSTHFYKRIMQMTAKSSVDSVRKEMIGRMQIPLPPTKAEQTAIAEVLSDMDAEIAALEARREKTRALKQAMMQELLTGRTRLIVPASESNATASPQPESPKTENRKSRSNGAHPEAQDAVLVS